MTKIRQNAEFFVILARLMLATVAASVPANAQEAWPKMLVDDKQCRVPLTIGEDYCGAACTGNVLASVANREVPTGTAGGEGYYGFQATVIPDRRRATIALDLTLQRASAPTPVADSGTTTSIF